VNSSFDLIAVSDRRLLAGWWSGDVRFCGLPIRGHPSTKAERSNNPLCSAHSSRNEIAVYKSLDADGTNTFRLEMRRFKIKKCFKTTRSNFE